MIRPACIRLKLTLPSVLVFLIAAPAMGHGDLTDQISEINAKIRMNPVSAEFYLKRAELHRLQGRDTEAVADYDRAEKLDPKLSGVHLGRARLLLASSRFAEAKAELDTFLASHPAHVDAIVTLGRVEAGRGRYLIAAEHFARAIALSPQPELEYYAERAAALAAAGGKHVSDALRCLDEGMTRLGNLPALGLVAVDLEVKLERFDAALTRLDGLSAVSHRKDAWLARRGDIFMAAGRSGEARQAWRSALDAIEKLPPHVRGTKTTAERAEKLTRLLAEAPSRQSWTRQQ
jgi:tetratricopeptide (TPR) repeat protein